ncbi:hypothetical protein DMN91_005427 [Ooceraea biroi]|uniref:Uncharacterized protein n=1 Tax=Ooceraea biroi TaxID=2015173 RepID=A0A3L8DTC5_OOCBI|nr:uncharacterized protein LOC105275137 [Ooceraea biroi]XP_019885864.1 uncharacterized protein LOC105275137 [Ooceraea biroi]RLU23149.1 hypothetical protein DMN91_005427 [Ooceraea biroi]
MICITALIHRNLPSSKPRKVPSGIYLRTVIGESCNPLHVRPPAHQRDATRDARYRTSRIAHREPRHAGLPKALVEVMGPEEFQDVIISQINKRKGIINDENKQGLVHNLCGSTA